MLGKKMILLAIRVPKDLETGCLVAEQIFATVHGVSKQLGLLDRLKGKSKNRISFEVAKVGRDIKFLVCFPEELRNLVEGQFYAQYPTAEITEVDDYVDGEDEYVFGTTLEMTNSEFYPIKRFSQFEDKKSKYAVDPLSAITSTLSKFSTDEEQAWVQIVISPLEDRWRKIYINCIRMLGNGLLFNIESLQKLFIDIYSSRNRFLRIVLFPLYYLFFLYAFRLGNAKINDADFKLQISNTHDRETSLNAAMDKVGRLMYQSSIRIIYKSPVMNPELAELKLQEIVGSFKQFNLPQINGFKMAKIESGKGILKQFKERRVNGELVLDTEELATIYHLPNITVNTPNIYWVKSKRLEPPRELQEIKLGELSDEVNLIGKTNYRGKKNIFGINSGDRRRHLYIIGKTGMGKSTLLENMIFSDIQNGRGVAVIDPHGDLADNVLNFVPAHRMNDVILFDPSDSEYPVAFNMFGNIDPVLNSIICSGLVGIFKKIYGNSWGPRLEHILRNSILSLLEYSNSSLLCIPRLLQDQVYRKRVVGKIKDPVVKGFWVNEFDQMDARQRVEAISPILNKVGQFLSSPVIRNIVGQVKSSIDIGFAMNKKKIFIANLAKGKIGEDNSALLGAMLITKFQLDAMSRANIPETERVDFYLYVDEFQNFATESFATILAEARKYRLNLTMANQYITQMPDEVRDAVFGNVGSMMSFQVGFDDAEYMSNAFGEEVSPNDLTSLNKYSAYMRLLIDGMPSKTFSLDTLYPPVLEYEENRREKIIRLSRERYAEKRGVVEEKINRWSASINGSV